MKLLCTTSPVLSSSACSSGILLFEYITFKYRCYIEGIWCTFKLTSWLRVLVYVTNTIVLHITAQLNIYDGFSLPGVGHVDPTKYQLSATVLYCSVLNLYHMIFLCHKEESSEYIFRKNACIAFVNLHRYEWATEHWVGFHTVFVILNLYYCCSGKLTFRHCY